MSGDKPAQPTSSGGLLSTLSLGSRRTPRASSEAIAHPLLGASTSSLVSDLSEDNTSVGRSPDSSLNVMSHSPSGTSPSGSGQLPYKPRQRHAAPQVSPAHSVSSTQGHNAPSPTGMAAAPTTSTTSTTIALPPSLDTAPLDATATSRLQLQSLKAAAQRIGLGNGSMGMGMIDSIFDKGARARAEGGDWADLLKVLTSGKAIILLPSSPASSLPMTPQTLRDHVAFLSPPISVTSGTATPKDDAAVLVTLSGMVGTLRGTTVAFESTVPTDAPLISSLRDDAQRVAVLARLRPTQTTEDASSFPNYAVSSESAPLSFPPLGKAVPIAVVEKPAVKEPARRINPFASLFGTPTVSSNTSLSPSLASTRPLSPEPSSGPGSGMSSPRPSIRSLDADPSGSPDAVEGYTIVAYMITKPVRYNEVHKALVKAVRSGVRAELKGLPDRVIEKTLRLVVSAVCPVSALNPADQTLLHSHHHGLGGETNATVTLDFSDPTATGERLQDFMEAIYDDLVTYYRTTESPRKPWSRASSVDTAEEEDESKKAQQREQYVEHAASQGTEAVEGLVCRLLYNRIFSPLHSDDSRHDEALASRIAALNMLDLSLDHLGLITRPPGEKPRGTISRGLARLCSDIGVELQKLSSPDCLTPKDKADVLVQAHKIAVDGLADLPAIKLRPEGEAYIAPSPEEEQEMTSMDEVEGQITESPTGSDAGLTESTDTVVEANPPTSGADVILPIMIYSVVKANPPQLASQLMYLRRYRSAICLVGEASYAIVNLTAVVEFLEHVQLSELGLGDSDRVMSVEDLTPIGLTYLDDGTDAASIASASSRLRGRVFQVSELAGSAAGSANKVITGVVDSSLSALRGMIGSTPQVTSTPPAEEELPTSPVTANRPNRPRQSSTFSLASVTASVANIAAAATTAAARTRSRASSRASDWPNQEMMEVASRPGSLREVRENDIYDTGSDAETEREDGQDEGRVEELDEGRSRSRSIMSVSSMMKDHGMSREVSSSGGTQWREASREREKEKEKEKERNGGGDRETIGGRLAQQIGGFRLGSDSPGTTPEKQSLFATLTRAPNRRNTTSGRRSPVPDEGPIDRFMTCEVGDIRLSEVGTLLRDYRRLAGALARLQERERDGR